jgi:hypothetical protein
VVCLFRETDSRSQEGLIERSGIANTYSTLKYQFERLAVGIPETSSASWPRAYDRSGRKWFDCADCHAEVSKHPLQQSFEMVRGLETPRSLKRQRVPF